jgi:hypothetical protein
LWGDESTTGQDAPDRGDGGDFRDVGVAGEVLGDGGRAGVVAGFVQGFAQPHDAFFHIGADGAGIGVRSA